MSTNISKEKRESLIDKIQSIKKFIQSNAQDENCILLMSYLTDIEKDIKGKKYGLVYEEHKENIDDILASNVPVLSEDKNMFIDRGKKINFLIEGDNLASLQLLEKTHKEKIDLIYIDPPYNTGSENFIYDDSFVTKEDLFIHSKWLSFMEKRLKLASSLLKKDGSIFISINENEVFGLKLLCDEIFGADNYLTTFAVKVRHENRILKGDKDFHEVFEYLLHYRKSIKHKTSKRIEDNSSFEDYVWNIKEVSKPFETLIMGGKKVEVYRPCDYVLEKGEPSQIKFKRISIRGSIKEGNSSGRFFIKYLNVFIGDKLGYVFKVENMGDDGFGYRYFIIPDKSTRKNGDYLQGLPLHRSNIKEVPYPNFLDFQKEFNNVGYEGGVEFRNGKKPIDFLKKCFDMGGFETGSKVLLDFFAGSGSSGHALFDYCKNKNVDHSFILCTNNENNICRDITYERIKKAIEKEDYQESLKYYKVEYVPISDKLYYEYADELLKHIRELVELENGINFIGNAEIAIILTEDELDTFTSNLNGNSSCKSIYLGHDVLPDENQKALFKRYNIKLNIIPDYYYRDLEG